MLNWFVIIVSVLHFSAVSAAFWCSHTILAFCGLLLFIFVEVYLLSGAELANSDLKAKCIALDKLIEARIEEVGEDALDTERHLRWFAQKSLLEFFQNHKAYVIFCLPNGKGVQNGGISQKIINAFMIIKRHTPFSVFIHNGCIGNPRGIYSRVHAVRDAQKKWINLMEYIPIFD